MKVGGEIGASYQRLPTPMPTRREYVHDVSAETSHCECNLKYCTLFTIRSFLYIIMISSKIGIEFGASNLRQLAPIQISCRNVEDDSALLFFDDPVTSYCEDTPKYCTLF